LTNKYTSAAAGAEKTHSGTFSAPQTELEAIRSSTADSTITIEELMLATEQQAKTDRESLLKELDKANQAACGKAGR
jgi:hypothetical protein